MFLSVTTCETLQLPIEHHNPSKPLAALTSVGIIEIPISFQSGCPNSKLAYIWSYRITNLSQAVFYNDTVNSTDDWNTNSFNTIPKRYYGAGSSNILKLPSKYLSVGEYELRVRALKTDLGDSMYIMIMQPELLARITGGSQLIVTMGNTANIDAQWLSRDPNNPRDASVLTFSWSCMKVNTSDTNARSVTAGHFNGRRTTAGHFNGRRVTASHFNSSCSDITGNYFNIEKSMHSF